MRAVVPGTEVTSESNSTDPRSYRVSFEKIRRRLGFDCRVTLRAGIEEIVAACRSGEVVDYRNPIYNNHSFLKERSGPGWDDENDVPSENSHRFLTASA